MNNCNNGNFNNRNFRRFPPNNVINNAWIWPNFSNNFQPIRHFNPRNPNFHHFQHRGRFNGGFKKNKYIPPLLQKPPSPLPGTEEYTNRSIEQKSDYIKQQLNIDDKTKNGKYKFTTNINVEPQLNCINDDLDKNITVKINNIKNKRKVKTTKIKPKYSEEEIYEKIFDCLAKLSFEKKKKLVNSERMSVDSVCHQTGLQERRILSRALRDFISQQTEIPYNPSQSVIPDFGVKIENLPKEFLEELSNLGIHFDNNSKNDDSCIIIEDIDNEDKVNCDSEKVDFFNFDKLYTQFPEVKHVNPLETFISSTSQRTQPFTELLNVAKKNKNYIPSTSQESQPFAELLNNVKQNENDTQSTSQETQPFTELLNDVKGNENDIPSTSQETQQFPELLNDKKNENDAPSTSQETQPFPELLNVVKGNENNKISERICNINNKNKSTDHLMQETSCNKIENYINNPKNINYPICTKELTIHKYENNIATKEVKTTKLNIVRDVTITPINETYQSKTQSINKFNSNKIHNSSKLKPDVTIELTNDSDLKEKNHKHVKNKMNYKEQSLQTPVVKFRVIEKPKGQFGLKRIKDGHICCPCVHVKRIKNASTQTDLIHKNKSVQTSFIKFVDTSEVAAAKKQAIVQKTIINEISKLDASVCKLMEQRKKLFDGLEASNKDSNIINMTWVKKVNKKRKYSVNETEKSSNKKLKSTSTETIEKNVTNEYNSSTSRNLNEQKNVAIADKNNINDYEKYNLKQLYVKLPRINLNKYMKKSTNIKKRKKFNINNCPGLDYNLIKYNSITKSALNVNTEEDSQEFFKKFGVTFKTVNGLLKDYFPNNIVTQTTDLKTSSTKEVLNTQENIEINLSSTVEANCDVEKEISISQTLNTSMCELPETSNNNTNSVKSSNYNYHPNRDNELFYKGYSGNILVIKAFESTLLAGSSTGGLYFYDISTTTLKDCIQVSELPVTSLIITVKDVNKFVYIGTHDEKLKIFNLLNKQLHKTVAVGEGIQSMHECWNYIFIGTRFGSIVRYNISKEKLEFEMKISKQSIMTLKTSQEGARRVLIVGIRNQDIHIRDAMSGLLMRFLHLPNNQTAYSFEFHHNYLYCGTSASGVYAYSFSDGEIVFKHETLMSRCIVCLEISGDLLFAGCYNSKIFIFNVKTNKYLGYLNGPEGLLLSLSITNNNKIVASTKSHFISWNIPEQFLI